MCDSTPLTLLLHNLLVQHPSCSCDSAAPVNARLLKYLDNLLSEKNPDTNKCVFNTKCLLKIIKFRNSLEMIREEAPSFAIDFLTHSDAKGQRCAVTPGIFSIRHRNYVWQESILQGTVFLLYGSYYDDRDPSGPLVRILAVADSISPPIPVCHIWQKKNSTVPMAVKAASLDYLHWQEALPGYWLPYIITCKIPKAEPPEAVSIVEYYCSSASNALKVHYNRPEGTKKDLALCTKFTYGLHSKFRKRLVEWIEMGKAWGVSDVTFYESVAYSDLNPVIQYYKNEGFASVIPWSNPGTVPNIPSMNKLLYDTQRYVLFTTENIPYTDCLLRHIHTHHYVAIWDLDEFIIPVQYPSLPAMINRIKNRLAKSLNVTLPASYLARCAYFFDDLEDKRDDFPEHLHLLKHVTRTIKYCPPNVHTKAIHDTSLALGLHAHFALFSIQGRVAKGKDLYNLYPDSEGYLGHFRDKCQGEDQTECLEHYRPFLVRDETLRMYQEMVIKNAEFVLKKIGLQ